MGLNIGETYLTNGGVLTASYLSFAGLIEIRGRLKAATVRYLGCSTGARGLIGDRTLDGRATLFALASYLSCTVSGAAGPLCPDDFATGLFKVPNNLPFATVTSTTVGQGIDDVTRACGVPQHTDSATQERIAAITSLRVAGLSREVTGRDLLAAFDLAQTYPPTVRGGGSELASATLRSRLLTRAILTIYGAGHCVRLQFPRTLGNLLGAQDVWLLRKQGRQADELGAWAPLVATSLTRSRSGLG